MFELATTATIKTNNNKGKQEGDTVRSATSFKISAVVEADELLPVLLPGNSDHAKFKEFFWNGTGNPNFTSDNGYVSGRKIGPLCLKVYDSFMDDKRKDLVLEASNVMLTGIKAMFNEGKTFDAELTFFMPINEKQGGALSVRVKKDVYLEITEQEVAEDPPDGEEGGN